MITTIYGEMPASELEHRTGTVDNDTELTTWTEYWLNNELVHRSVHVHLKQGIDFGAAAADFS